MSVYFDGLRALVQFSGRSSDQILRLTEHFHLRLVENSGRMTPSENLERDVEAPPVLAVAGDLRQFLSSLISVYKFKLDYFLHLPIFLHLPLKETEEN